MTGLSSQPVFAGKASEVSDGPTVGRVNNLEIIKQKTDAKRGLYYTTQ